MRYKKGEREIREKLNKEEKKIIEGVGGEITESDE